MIFALIFLREWQQNNSRLGEMAGGAGGGV